MDGTPVSEISKVCGCTAKTVYKTAATHGLHRKRGLKKAKPVLKPKPKVVDFEPMYREIPTHMCVNNIDERRKSLLAELKEYRATHEKPWYLK